MPRRASRHTALPADRPGAGRLTTAVVALSVLAILLIVAAFALPASPAHPGWYGNDSAVYWQGAKAFTSGDDIYAVQPRGTYFTYPPFAAAVFAPLAMTSLGVATTIVVFLGAAATVSFTVLSCRAASVFPARWHIAGPLALSVPALCLYVAVSGYLVGQIDALVALLVLVDTVRPDSRRLPRGVLIGVAIALKVTPLIFLGALLVRRQLRTSAAVCLTAALCLVIGSIPRPGAVLAYVTDALGDTSRVGPVAVTQNQSLAGFIARAAGDDPTTLTGGSRVLWALCCFVVVAFGAFAVHRLSKRGQQFEAVLAAALVGLLVSPISWMHHWIWVIAVVVALARIACATRHFVAGALAVIGVVVASYGPQWLFAAVGPYDLPHLLGVDALVIWGLVTLGSLPFLPVVSRSARA